LKNKAVFLDRDGVIINDVGHLNKKAQVKLINGASKAIKLLNKYYLVIVISNQSVIARGMATISEVEEINQYILDLLLSKGAKIDAVYFCPHHPDFTGKCDCRKPEIGLFRQAEKDFKISMKASYMIGDKPIDIEAGKKAGCKTILVNNTISNQENNLLQKPDFECSNLLDAAKIILSGNKLA
jgi:D-glycero-D-manno-heptose 1,7-bisphosphate phosphatase